MPKHQTPMDAIHNSRFGILLKDTLACELEESATEPKPALPPNLGLMCAVTLKRPIFEADKCWFSAEYCLK